MSQLIDLFEVSERLGISPDAVATHIRAGRLKGVNVGNGSQRPRWKVSIDDLEEFVAARTTAPAPTKARKRKTAGEVIEFFAVK